MNAYLMHIAPRDIEYDPAKAAANKHKHSVSFAYVEQALRDQRAATMDAKGEARYVTLGMDPHGRVLLIVWIPRNDKARIVSARKASKSQAKTHVQ